MSSHTTNVKERINDAFYALARMRVLVEGGISLDNEDNLLEAGIDAIAAVTRAQGALQTARSALRESPSRQPTFGAGADLGPTNSPTAASASIPETRAIQFSGATSSSASPPPSIRQPPTSTSAAALAPFPLLQSPAQPAGSTTISALAPPASLPARPTPAAAQEPERRRSRAGRSVRARGEAKRLFAAFVTAVLPLQLESFHRLRSTGLLALDASPPRYADADIAVEGLRDGMMAKLHHRKSDIPPEVEVNVRAAYRAWATFYDDFVRSLREKRLSGGR